jgi:hypothetical protein
MLSLPLQKLTYLTPAYYSGGGRGSAHRPEISLTLVRHFYDDIMITLATDLIDSRHQ